MQFLKQSTAIDLKIGPFLDEDDGKTVEGGLTINQADVRLSKNGGDFAQKNDITACTVDEAGWYQCPINGTDTGTLGRLQLQVHVSGALPVWQEFMIVPANVWDSFFGSDILQVDLTQCGGSAVAAGAIPNAAAAASGGLPTVGTGAGQVNPDGEGNVSADVKQWNGTAVTLSPTTAKPQVDAFSVSDDAAAANNLETACDGGAYNVGGGAVVAASVTGNVGGSVGSVAGAVASVTGNVGGNVVGTIGSLAAQAKADVKAEADAALSDIDLDHLIQVTAGVEEPTDGSYLDQIMHKGAGQTFDATTDSLEAIRDTEPLGTAMRGTDSAALASVCTEGRLSELDAANLPADLDAVKADTDSLDTTKITTTRASNLDNLDATVSTRATAAVCTEARLAELDAANLPADIDAIKADLPQKITKNVALNNFCFLMVDSADHVTPKTGLTITAQRSIDGAAFGACANSATEISNGYYKINLANTDLNGDVIILKFSSAGADDRGFVIVTQKT